MGDAVMGRGEVAWWPGKAWWWSEGETLQGILLPTDCLNMQPWAVGSGLPSKS
jgi:hypothetical protein